MVQQCQLSSLQPFQRKQQEQSKNPTTVGFLTMSSSISAQQHQNQLQPRHSLVSVPNEIDDGSSTCSNSTRRGSTGSLRRKRHSGLLKGVSKLMSSSTLSGSVNRRLSDSLAVLEHTPIAVPTTPVKKRHHRRLESDASTDTYVTASDEGSLTASFRVLRISKLSVSPKQTQSTARLALSSNADTSTPNFRIDLPLLTGPKSSSVPLHEEMTKSSIHFNNTQRQVQLVALDNDMNASVLQSKTISTIQNTPISLNTSSVHLSSIDCNGDDENSMARYPLDKYLTSKECDKTGTTIRTSDNLYTLGKDSAHIECKKSATNVRCSEKLISNELLPLPLPKLSRSVIPASRQLHDELVCSSKPMETKSAHKSSDSSHIPPHSSQLLTTHLGNRNYDLDLSSSSQLYNKKAEEASKVPLPPSQDTSVTTSRSSLLKDHVMQAFAALTGAEAGSMPTVSSSAKHENIAKRSGNSDSLPILSTEVSENSTNTTLSSKTSGQLSSRQNDSDTVSFVLPALTCKSKKKGDVLQSNVSRTTPIQITPTSLNEATTVVAQNLAVIVPNIPSFNAPCTDKLSMEPVSTSLNDLSFSKDNCTPLNRSKSSSTRNYSTISSVSRSKSRNLGPIDVDLVSEMFGTDSSSSSHSSTTYNIASDIDTKEKALIIVDEEVSEAPALEESRFPTTNALTVSASPSRSIFERLLLYSTCEGRDSINQNAVGISRDRSDFVVSTAGSFLASAATTAISIISPSLEDQSAAAIRRRAETNGVCVCAGSARSVMSTITEGSTFTGQYAESSMTTENSILSFESEGPVDVDEFIPKDSYYLYDNHEIVLDETEFSRGLAGYEVGFEPDIIWEYESSFVHHDFFRSTAPILEEEEGEIEDDVKVNVKQNAEVSTTKKVTAQFIKPSKTHLIKRTAPSVATMTIASSCNQSSQVQQRKTQNVRNKGSPSRRFLQKKRKSTTCRTSMFSI